MRKILASILCLGLVIGLYGCSPSLSNYEWGESLQKVLDEIKVESVKSVEDETSEATKGIVANVKIKTDIRTLSALLSKNNDGTWDVLSISDDDDYKIIYYEKDHLQVDDNGNQKDNIYDYTTGELIKKATTKTDKNKSLTKEELKSKTRETFNNYKITDLSILTRTAGDGYIISLQIEGNINKNEAKEIGNKISKFNKFYEIQVVNNGKLILSYDQDSK